MSHGSKFFYTHRNKATAFLFIAVFAMSLIGVRALYAYTSDTNVYQPPNYTGFQPPAKGGSYTDPVFGTAIKRLSDSMHMVRADNGSTLATISPEYSTMSPFNKDNTYLILEHFSYFGLYDGAGNYLRDLPLQINASSEPRWSKKDPNILYYLYANQLKQINAGTGQMAVVHTFSEYSAIKGNGESDISEDGDHFVFAGDGHAVFEYEISTDTKGPIFDTGGHGFDSLYITPNNNVTITWFASGTSRYQGIEMFDRNMNFLRQVARAGGHMDVSRDTNGDEVLLWTNSADPSPIPNCQNGIVKIRLSDARQTCLVQLDWSLAVHVSAPDNSGWVFVETYNPSDIIPPTSSWKTYTDEFLQIKLDGSEVRRLAHHRSRPLNSYTYMPKISTSHDGTKVVFGSNFGLQAQLGYPTEYSDAYMIDVSVASPNTGGTTSGTSTSDGSTSSGSTSSGSTSSGSTSTGSTSTGSTSSDPTSSSSTGSTSTSTTTRVEQNSSSVQYTGSWSAISNSIFSGGSAVEAMDPGYRATFSFNGTGANWIGYTDEWSGIARIYVDGVLQTTVDTYSTPNKAQKNVYAVTGLVNGSHTLAIEATGTRNPASGGSWIWIDAFEVVSGTSSTSSGSTTGSTSGTTSDSTSGSTSGSTSSSSSDSTSSSSSTTTTTTRVEQNAGGIQYVGTWNTINNSVLSGGSAVQAMDPGYRATFTFTGTGANWIGYSDEWSGIAKVYVDGIVKGTVDTYSTPNHAQKAMYSVTGLASGTHTLAIEATGTKNSASGGAWIWVDAFEVISGTSSTSTSGSTSGSTSDSTSGSTSTTPPPAPSGTLYRVEETSSAVNFSGTWFVNTKGVHSGGSAKLAMDTASKATFTFTGNAVTWIAYRDQWSGIAQVYIDGVLKGTVDTYSSANSARTAMFSATGLSWGTHTIVIQATGKHSSSSNGSWIWVDAFDYVGQ